MDPPTGFDVNLNRDHWPFEIRTGVDLEIDVYMVEISIEDYNK